MAQSMAKRPRLDNEAVMKELECPVCKVVPREGPIYECPNGHLVCQECKRGTCPICREAMGHHRSLLAVALIEKIYHECKHDECDEVFKLENLSDHEKLCKHRTVSCPDDTCDKKLALSKLVDHLKSSRTCSVSENVHILNEKTKGIDMPFLVSAGGSKSPKLNWRVLVCSNKGANFVLRVKKSGDFYDINIVMFDTEEECCKYNIEMEVFKSNSPPASRHSVKFRGNPCSIDKTKAEIENVGLTVHREVVEKMALLEDGTLKFTVSFSFF